MASKVHWCFFFFFIGQTLLAKNILIAYRDADNDGFGDPYQSINYPVALPNGYVTNADDCDDSNPNIYPGAPEICYDGVDNNCNGDFIDGCSQFTTQLRSNYCNAVLPSMNETIRASTNYVNELPNEVFVNAYRFRIKNLSTNQTGVIQKSNYLMKLFESSIVMYDCSFLIEVSIQLNNEWMAYGPGCIIHIPPVPNTIMDDMSCNQRVQNMNSIIRAKPIPVGSRYHFEVALIENGIAVETTNLIKVGASFNLLQLQGLSLKYSAEYSVRVKAEGSSPNGLVWSTDFSPPCSVFSPHLPEVRVEGCAEENGIHPTSLTTVIYVNPIGGVNNFRYTLSHEDGYSQTITSLQRTFRLSNFNQLQPLTPGEVYSLAVETMIYGYYYYGKDCNIKVPGGNGVQPNQNGIEEKNDFEKGIVFPNPSNDYFNLKWSNDTPKILHYTIIDRFGRIIEDKKTEYTKEGLLFGEDLPQGIYILQVKDEQKVWTEKLIKR